MRSTICDGLAAVVLVDVLDAVDDLVIAVGLALEDVAGGEPVVAFGVAGGEGDGAARAGLLEVAGHVMAADLQLALGAQAGPDAGKRQAVRAVDVAARRGHGDAPGRLGHAEAAHQLDAVAGEEAEDAGIEVAGRRQAPLQARPDDLADEGRRVRPGRGGVQALQALLVELDPADGDADEAGRPDPGQQAEERLGRRIAGEDVGAAPVDGPEHLQEAAEGVVERQEAQEDLVRTHGGQGGGPGEALGDEVVEGERDALGPAGGARSEHDRGHLVDAEAAAPGQPGVDVPGPELLAELRQEDDVAVVAEGRVGDQDEEGPGRPAPGLLEQGDPLAVVGQGQVDGQGVEDGDHVVEVEMRVEGGVQDVVEQAGQVGEGALGVVLGVNGQPRLEALAVG